jgi:hypothetical protein
MSAKKKGRKISMKAKQGKKKTKVEISEKDANLITFGMFIGMFALALSKTDLSQESMPDLFKPDMNDCFSYYVPGLSSPFYRK